MTDKQLTNEARAEGKCACTMPCKEEEDERQQVEDIVRQIARSFSGADSTKDWTSETIWFNAAPYASVGVEKAKRVFDEAFGNLKCNGLCAYKDELRPLLEKILATDAFVMGTPIYWSYPTGMFRNVIERLLFPILRYDLDEKTGGASKYIDKKMPTALIYTMNNTPERYDLVNYGTILAPDQQYMQMMFGSCEVLNSFNTWQFPDYSKYDSSAIDVKEKQWFRDNQWPKDLQATYELGKRMVELTRRTD